MSENPGVSRRDLIKVMTLGAVAANLETARAEDDVIGPFARPTVRFQGGNQHEFPREAFTLNLPIPLVPRPTFIGTWEKCQAATHPFGPGDAAKLGECFHGIAREWQETPPHWQEFGCKPELSGWDGWKDKAKNFGRVRRFENAKTFLRNWGGGEIDPRDRETESLPVKCYKIPIVESFARLDPRARHDARVYSYAGMVPGPSIKMRLGQPVVVRFENHLEAETSIHLHGGHSPSHSDGFPTFYVLQDKARDYFYPNILPLYPSKGGAYEPDIGESQSTMWYHDHAMDATAYNVSKGLAGFAPCFGEEELRLIATRVLPGLGAASCFDPEAKSLRATPVNPDPENLEDSEHPGFYAHEQGKEPYYNPYDVPLVMQDRVIDFRTGQIAYDNTGHNGYIGATMLVNATPWPRLDVDQRKYRFRILDGSNARVYRLRIMHVDDFERANRDGIDAVPNREDDPAVVNRRPNEYDAKSIDYLRIGKDSWLWSHAVAMKAMTMAMANRADIVVDFDKHVKKLKPGQRAEFVLVNTMPQFDGRGPKSKLDDGGDPRVLPLPFDGGGRRLVEVNRPIPLIKFVVTGPRAAAGTEATVEDGTKLWVEELRAEENQANKHRPIPDEDVRAVREFIFERGKGLWQINGRFYDPTIANAAPVSGGAEEWVLRNGGGGWWHPIHIHLESHQLIRYEKDFDADRIVDARENPAVPVLRNLQDVTNELHRVEVHGMHDTMVLGPNTVVRIRMRHRTWTGPFVFHCHNVEHEDMRMMFNFEPVPQLAKPPTDLHPNIAPTARTHGNDVTFNGGFKPGQRVGELPWEYPPIPRTPTEDSGEDLIERRPKAEVAP
jgi:FtsP/CotA-like multicopper oxidase with cupredoxin domain